VGSQHSALTAAARARFDQALRGSAQNARSRRAPIVEAINRTLDKLATDPAALNGTITSWVPRALFLLLPLFALLLSAFYWRQRRAFLFVDHLVFSLSFHSFAFALLFLAALAAQILPGGLVGIGVLAAILVYLLLAMRRLYRQSWLWTGMKFAALTTIYTMLFLVPAFAGILALSFLGIDQLHLG
jgi:hypothetical protein